MAKRPSEEAKKSEKDKSKERRQKLSSARSKNG
jgi:hypothetical protein